MSMTSLPAASPTPFAPVAAAAVGGTTGNAAGEGEFAGLIAGLTAPVPAFSPALPSIDGAGPGEGAGVGLVAIAGLVAGEAGEADGDDPSRSGSRIAGPEAGSEGGQNLPVGLAELARRLVSAFPGGGKAAGEVDGSVSEEEAEAEGRDGADVGPVVPDGTLALALALAPVPLPGQSSNQKVVMDQGFDPGGATAEDGGPAAPRLGVGPEPARGGDDLTIGDGSADDGGNTPASTSPVQGASSQAESAVPPLPVGALPEPAVGALPEPAVRALPEPAVKALPGQAVGGLPEPAVMALPEQAVEALPEPAVRALPEPAVKALPGQAVPIAEPPVAAVAAVDPKTQGGTEGSFVGTSPVASPLPAVTAQVAAARLAASDLTVVTEGGRPSVLNAGDGRIPDRPVTAPAASVPAGEPGTKTPSADDATFDGIVVETTLSSRRDSLPSAPAAVAPVLEPSPLQVTPTGGVVPGSDIPAGPSTAETAPPGPTPPSPVRTAPDVASAPSGVADRLAAVAGVMSDTVEAPVRDDPVAGAATPIADATVDVPDEPSDAAGVAVTKTARVDGAITTPAPVDRAPTTVQSPTGQPDRPPVGAAPVTEQVPDPAALAVSLSGQAAEAAGDQLPAELKPVAPVNKTDGAPADADGEDDGAAGPSARPAMAAKPELAEQAVRPVSAVGPAAQTFVEHLKAEAAAATAAPPAPAPSTVVDPALAAALAGQGAATSSDQARTAAGSQSGSSGAGGSSAVPAPMIGIEIAKRFTAGETDFRIRLSPESLGEIEVRLNFTADGEARAHIQTERQETFDLFARDQKMIEKTLRDAGFDVRDNSVSLSMRQEGGSGQGDRGAQQQLADQQGRDGNGRPQRHPLEVLQSGEAESPRPVVDAYRPRPDALVDMRL